MGAMFSPNMLLKLSLEKIIAECGPKNKDIADICNKRLAEFKEEDAQSKQVSQDAPIRKSDSRQIGMADDFWEPIKLSIEQSQSVKLREVALDCLQKLIAHSLFTGRRLLDLKLDEKSDTPLYLIDEVVELVCKSYSAQDESLQIQIIKVLLTCVTSNTCEVHGPSLIKVFQTCFGIYLQSKSAVNQVTSKACLTQICHFVMQKMETFVKSTKHEVPVLDDAMKSAASQSPLASSPTEELEDRPPDSSLPTSANHFKSLTSNIESFNSPPGKYGYCLVCLKPADHFCSNTKDPVCSAKCKNQNLRVIGKEKADVIVGSVGPTSFSETDNSPPTPDSGKVADESLNENDKSKLSKLHDESNQVYLSLLRRDCKFVLRFLCRLSIKFDSEEPQTIALKGRTLALELIMSTLEISGLYFRKDAEFIQLIRKNLCLSLSKNGVNSNLNLFELSLQIFIFLLENFKASLKPELEVLFNEIYLQILDMVNATALQKGLVLQGLLKLCENGQNLLDIYVNYDCDFVCESLYEGLVNGLSKMAQGGTRRSSISSIREANNQSSSTTGAEVGSPADKKLRFLSLKCLVTLVSSIYTWYKQIEEIPQNQARPSLEDKEKDQTVEFNEECEENLLDNPTLYEQAKSKKQQMKQGIILFNSKPQKGIELLIQSNLIQDDLDSIADFLLNTSALSKRAIGEYLGEGNTLNIKVMHKFVDKLDFTGMKFVDALRFFLQSFRLPGESQKIDRLMEKFADRFTENNPGVFMKSADMAYTMAYSVIMLNTDLYSKQVKSKMEKASFIKLNKSIVSAIEGVNIEEFLGEIYDDIACNEIVLEEEQLNFLSENLSKRFVVGKSEEKVKLELYKKESERIKKKSEALIAGGSTKNMSPFRSASRPDHVRPMFSVTWGPLLAVLSLTFEEISNSAEENEFVELCLKGFHESIKLACLFRMETEREAFISALCKFTTFAHPNDLRGKNVGAIKLIITIAGGIGNDLETSWYSILQVISRLERIDEDFVPTSPFLSAENSSSRSNLNVIKRSSSVLGLIDQNSLVAIDHIFANSINLNGDSISYFFKALCDVSKEETENSRMFSLQKIVEIAYYNMSRIRLEWSAIWKILSPYFNSIGLHPNLTIATFAIDSLRQLSCKFLDKDELSHFHTQNEFLKPFEYIMKHYQNFVIKELILQSLGQIVMSRAKNIKSGWKSIFVVFSRAAQTSLSATLTATQNLTLLKLSYETTCKIHESYFEHVILYGFVDFISCLVSFSVNDLDEEIVRGSIKMFQSCSSFLFKDDKGILEEEDFYLKWFPLLSGFSRIVIDSDSSNVRTMALDSLFELITKIGYIIPKENISASADELNAEGMVVKSSYWKPIYRSVLMPVFEDLKDPEIKRKETASTVIWIQALRQMVDLLSVHYDKLADSIYFGGILELVSLMATRKNENLSQTGIICLHQLISKNLDKFGEKEWMKITILLESIINLTLPSEWLPKDEGNQIEQVKEDAEEPIDMPVVEDSKYSAMKSNINLSLLQTLKDLFVTENVFQKFPNRAVQKRWLDMVQSCIVFWTNVNKTFSIRQNIAKLTQSNVENVIFLKQETSAVLNWILMNLKLLQELHDISQQELDEWIVAPLMVMVLSLFQKYEKMNQSSGLNKRDLGFWSPIVERVVLELKDVFWYHPHDILNIEHLQIFKNSYLKPVYYRIVPLLAASTEENVSKACIEFLENVGRDFFPS